MPRRTEKPRPTLSVVGRVGIALTHPLRVRILFALAAGEGSATRLSNQFGDASVSDVSYHLGVLADDCDLVEQVRVRPVRGAMENFYRLKRAADLTDIQLPPVVSQALRVELFSFFVDAALASLDAGVLDDEDETTFSARPVTVDQRGMAEINRALREALGAVQQAEKESRRRL